MLWVMGIASSFCRILLKVARGSENRQDIYPVYQASLKMLLLMLQLTVVQPTLGEAPQCALMVEPTCCVGAEALLGQTTTPSQIVRFHDL
jgi:hypothetical protein